VQWSVNLPPGLPRTRAPEELLSIVLDNLLDNAVKFAGRKDVCVEVSAREAEDRVLRVAVHDNGPGIRPQDRDQVFSDFTQLEDTFTGNITGVGLGLATAKRLVESWGGQIDFESVPGQGATFFFTVPSEFSPVR
jgi:signal transduction histidine kinase